MNHLSTIWVLFGIPVTQQEYLQRFKQSENDPPSDFLLKYDAPGAPPEARRDHFLKGWNRAYRADVADPMARLMETSQRLGCTVISGATLAHLADACKQADVIILNSHWKGPEFGNMDFLPGLERHFDERIATGTDPLIAWLRAATTRRRGWFKPQPKPPRDALRASLAVDLGRSEAAIPAGLDNFVELPATRAARRRDRLDGLLHEWTRPGNRLELFDGLHAKEAVAEALGGFAGILDLTTCTSTYLGDHLANASAYRYRTVQFLTKQDAVDAAVRLEATLEIAAQGYDYLAARDAVAGEFEAVTGAYAKEE